MWCRVSQPNGVLLDVELDHKAKGQQCLEMVSQVAVPLSERFSRAGYLFVFVCHFLTIESP